MVSATKDRTNEESRAVSPLESRLGIVDFWTSHAAKQALWVVTQMTPGKSEEMFQRIGNMAPSKSSLDRPPKTLSKTWEADREQFEETLRASLQIPVEATTVVVSLDGVLASRTRSRWRSVLPMRGVCAGTRRLQGGRLRDALVLRSQGEMIAAVRIARSPEWKKMSLKSSLAATRRGRRVIASRSYAMLYVMRKAGSIR